MQANDEHPGGAARSGARRQLLPDARAAAVALESLNHPQDRFLAYTLDQTMKTLKPFVGRAGDRRRAGGAPTGRPASRIVGCRHAPQPARSGRAGDRIGTLPEQMLFDVRWFVVETGKPVRVVLTNPDAMPHNLLVGAPGSLSTIGTAAPSMAPPADPNARAYVPDIPLVLQATKLLQQDETDQLNFTAPENPGEYVFVCTFPGHWTRMYGVMLVVRDQKGWEATGARPPNRSGYRQAVRFAEERRRIG